MRPIEILICAATCIVLVFCLMQQMAGWIRWLPAVTLLLILAQIVFEGARWQMAPAWLVAIYLFASLTVPLPNLVPGPRVAAAGLALLTMAIVLGSVFPVFRLPRPTGPHAIGSAALHLVDSARQDTLTHRADGRRELMVRIWYPAERAGPAESYLQAAETTFLRKHLSLVRTNASAAAPAGGRFPVILFLPSWGGGKAEATVQTEELASHGFVVVGIDHPHGSRLVLFPDGRIARSALTGFLDYATDESLSATERIAEEQLRIRVADARFVLDELARLNRSDPDGRFTDRLDLSRIGAFGHSFGGAVSAELCRVDARVLAGADLDGLIFGESRRSGFGKPFFFFSDETRIPPASVIESSRPPLRRRWRFLAENDECIRRGLAQVNGHYAVLHGAKHSNFSDAPLHSPLKRVLPLGDAEAGSIEPELAARIVKTYLLSFFRNHLKNEDDGLLNRAVPPYAELELGIVPARSYSR